MAASIPFKDSNGVEWAGFLQCSQCNGWHIPRHKSDKRVAAALLMGAEDYCGGCFDQLVAKQINKNSLCT